MMKKNKEKGFTLIELLVVIAIIAILASVLLAMLNNARGKARNAAAVATIKGLVGPLQICLNDNKSFNTPTETNSGGGGAICTSSVANFSNLPSGWIYCDGTSSVTNSTSDCGNDISTLATGTSWVINVQSSADGQLVTCSSANNGVCTSVADSD